jgi:hypothetical protein
MDMVALDVVLFVLGGLIGWLVAWLFYRKHKKHIERLEQQIQNMNETIPQKTFELMMAHDIPITSKVETEVRKSTADLLSWFAAGIPLAKPASLPTDFLGAGIIRTRNTISKNRPTIKKRPEGDS